MQKIASIGHINIKWHDLCNQKDIKYTIKHTLQYNVEYMYAYMYKQGMSSNCCLFGDELNAWDSQIWHLRSSKLDDFSLTTEL